MKQHCFVWNNDKNRKKSLNTKVQKNMELILMMMQDVHNCVDHGLSKTETKSNLALFVYLFQIISKYPL